jgi:hypothetical protein
VTPTGRECRGSGLPPRLGTRRVEDAGQLAGLPLFESVAIGCWVHSGPLTSQRAPMTSNRGTYFPPGIAEITSELTSKA